MLRRHRVLVTIAVALIALPLLLVGTVLIVGNTDSGRGLIERTTDRLTAGQVTLQGPAADLAANPEVQAAYLGG